MFRGSESATTTITAPARPRPAAPRDLVAVMLTAARKLQARPHLKVARAHLEKAGNELADLLNPERRPDWAWFEIVFEADACRLPEALLRAGRVLDRDDLTDRGIETLEWMIRGRVLDTCLDTMITACDAAFAATGELKWLMISRTATPAPQAFLPRR